MQCEQNRKNPGDLRIGTHVLKYGVQLRSEKVNLAIQSISKVFPSYFQDIFIRRKKPIVIARESVKNRIPVPDFHIGTFHVPGKLVTHRKNLQTRKLFHKKYSLTQENKESP